MNISRDRGSGFIQNPQRRQCKHQQKTGVRAAVLASLENKSHNGSGANTATRKELIMGFNYGYERNKMEQDFLEMKQICEAENKADIIEAIHRLMLDELNSDRRFYTHTQSYDDLRFSDGEEADEDRSPLLDKFLDQLSVTQGEICEWGRMYWLEDIDIPELIEWLKAQSEQDIEFLTLLIIDELKQSEIAQIWNCSSTAVSKRKKRIMDSLQSILPEQIKKLYRI